MIFGKDEKKDQAKQAPAAPKATQAANKAEGKSAKDPNVLSQREAVFRAICGVMKSKNITVKSKQPVKEVLTSEHLQSVYTPLMGEFRAKKIALKDNENNREKLGDDKLLKVYVIGLVGNWLRRDKRLNGESEFRIS